MSAAPNTETSFPYVIVAVIAVGLVVGAWMYTVTDPVAQAVFASNSYSAPGTGGNLLGWFKIIWNKLLPLVFMVGILFEVWVVTRREG